MPWYPDDYDDAPDDYHEGPWQYYEDEEPPYREQLVSRSPYSDVVDDDLYFMAMMGDIGADMEIYNRESGGRPVVEPLPAFRKSIWKITWALIGISLICGVVAGLINR